jgi:hypothetical protein
MNIKQIAERLNEKAATEGFQIADLSELRKKYLHKKRLPSKIFTWQTIFDGEDKYAFHNGGRDEMQFNFGEEYSGHERVFSRYALSFSLEASHSLPNPVRDLEPYRKRFNQCIETHPDFFDGFEIWYYQNGERFGNLQAQIITDEWFQRGTFICVGNIIEKPLEELNENDLTQILKGFDSLLPIYQFCVLQSPSVLSKERRIAKVCWNKNDWVYPSAEFGKSNDAKSHERKRGYGHEEWLFDFAKLIGGYHYALLQPVQKGRETFLNKSFDVRLYSHNSDTKENLWVGIIENLEVISKEVAKDIYSQYKDKGWLDEMAQDIKSINGDISHFRKLKPYECFNVRFKPEYAKLDKPYKSVENFNNSIGTYHYQFVRDKTQSPVVEAKGKKRIFKFKSGKSEKSLASRVSTRQRSVVQSEPLHDKIQEVLYSYLVALHGESKVGMETDTGLTTRIDVSVNSSEGIILYEVKSYPSVMLTIREALGQLLEYAYYPSPIDNLKEIIIVSHIRIGPEDKEYLEFIRQTTSLRLFYQSVDVDKRTISEKL